MRQPCLRKSIPPRSANEPIGNIGISLVHRDADSGCNGYFDCPGQAPLPSMAGLARFLNCSQVRLVC